VVEVTRFVNDLMSSNCYVIHDSLCSDCVIVDPGSKNSESEISLCNKLRIYPRYIILTHEHTDHTWGANALVDRYDSKVICSQQCKDRLGKEGQSYFLFYYNDPNYSYNVKRVDITVGSGDIIWNSISIKFLYTPGHSIGSMCFFVGDNLFTGDTLMQCETTVDKKRCSDEIYRESLKTLNREISMRSSVIVYPGHGDMYYIK